MEETNIQPENPYQAPGASYATPLPESGYGDTPTQGALNALAGSRGWMIWIGILGIFSAAIMISVGVAMPLAIGGIASSSGSMQPEILMLSAIFGIYVLVGIVYLIGALYPIRSARAIGRARRSGDVADVQRGLSQQRKFFKFCGIIIILYFVLYLIAIVGMMGAMFFKLNMLTP